MSTPWKQAGMSYLRYANLCAVLTRRVLKPEFRTKAIDRDAVSMRIEAWENGKPLKRIPNKQAEDLLKSTEF